jgi:hypothetical protein
MDAMATGEDQREQSLRGRKETRGKEEGGRKKERGSPG